MVFLMTNALKLNLKLQMHRGNIVTFDLFYGSKSMLAHARLKKEAYKLYMFQPRNTMQESVAVYRAVHVYNYSP